MVVVGWLYLLRTAETWRTGVTFGHDPERRGEGSARGVGGEATGGLDNGLPVHLEGRNCGCGDLWWVVLMILDLWDLPSGRFGGWLALTARCRAMADDGDDGDRIASYISF